MNSSKVAVNLKMSFLHLITVVFSRKKNTKHTMYIVYFGIWKDLVLLKKMLFNDTLFHNLKWQDGWKIKVVWIVS